MKLYGYETIWEQTAPGVGELMQPETARQAMRQLYPAGAEPVQLVLCRGLAARGDEACPLLALRACVRLDGGAPRIAPAEDGYRLCAQTLRHVLGIERETLKNLETMLAEAQSPDVLSTVLDVWSRLLRGRCAVEPGQAALLAVREAYPAPGDAAPPERAGACSLDGWVRMAAEYAADGRRVLLTARNMDRLRAAYAAFPEGMPALCGWDDGPRVQAFAAQLLDDAGQAGALALQAARARRQAEEEQAKLRAARQAVDHFRAEGLPAGAEEQAHNDQILPDDIPAGAPFPLDDSELALLRAVPSGPCSVEDGRVAALCAQWDACRAQYEAAPVRVGGQPVSIPAGALTLGSGPRLGEDALPLLLALARAQHAFEQEEWMLEAIACENEAQLALYRALLDALDAAAQHWKSCGDLPARRVQYRGDSAQRAAALDALRTLEDKCEAWETDEPYAFSDFARWRAVRAAAKVHCTLVDGAPPRTSQDCRAARMELETQAYMQQVREAWRPLCGSFRRSAADCGALAEMLRLCLACNASGLHLRADELPLPKGAADCIGKAQSLAQEHAALCQIPAPAGVQEAVRALDWEAYRAACAQAAQDACQQAQRGREEVVERVRLAAPQWAARLDAGICPEEDIRAAWEEKSARAARTDGIGRLLAHERALSGRCRAMQLEACALAARAAAAQRAQADPLVLSLLTRAARGQADAAACAACAPIFLTASGREDGFDQALVDSSGMDDTQLAWQAARAARVRIVDVLPSHTPELRLISTDGSIGYCRAAEQIIQGRLSTRMCRVWWQTAGDEEDNGLPAFVQRAVERGGTVAVVSPAPAEERRRLADGLPAELLAEGTLYCGDASVLSARRFDAVIFCPGLAPQQFTAAARASLDAGTLWVLGAEQYGDDWGRGLLLAAWQDDGPVAAYSEQADTVARVLDEMYGWETAARAGGLEVHTPAGPVWLALLGCGGAYPADSPAREALYQAGWTLDGLSLAEYAANPRQALRRLAIYEEGPDA